MRSGRAIGESREGEGVVAVVPAAGAGVRMGSGRPKQFMELGGRPVLAVTLEAFQSCPIVGRVVLVAPEEALDYCRAGIVEQYGLTKVSRVVAGGGRRQDSVRMGLEACTGLCRVIVVHDGVRPLVRPALIERIVSGAIEHGAAVAAVPARDTVKEVDPGQGRLVVRTLDRSLLRLVQTPQAFHAGLLRDVHKRAQDEAWDEASDDAQLVERAGITVTVMDGDEDNIKVTTPGDLALARYLLDRRAADTPDSGVIGR